MGKQNVVRNKVQDRGNGNFKVDKGDGPHEVAVDIDMRGAGKYQVDKLETHTLPTNMPAPDNTGIRWINNFSIKHQGGGYVQQAYTVKITGLQAMLKEKSSKLVIYSENHVPNLYYLDPQPTGDTFELEDGDPGGGMAP